MCETINTNYIPFLYNILKSAINILIENTICWFLSYGTIIITILLLILIYYIRKLIQKMNKLKHLAQQSNEYIYNIFNNEILGIKQDNIILKESLELSRELFESKILLQIKIIKANLSKLNKNNEKIFLNLNRLENNINDKNYITIE